jgi:hypothetical protein
MILQILYTIYIMKHIFFHSQVSRKKAQEEAKLKNDISTQNIKPRILSMNTIALTDNTSQTRKYRKGLPVPSHTSEKVLPKITPLPNKMDNMISIITKTTVPKEFKPTTSYSPPLTNIVSENIPPIVFIIPYRDRSAHRSEFLEAVDIYFKTMKQNKDYIMIFSHQFDERPFNRGAMKNLGFLYVKEKYPKDYKNITFVFNDVDTYPLFDVSVEYYRTTHKNIKHFYGLEIALGGSFSITGYDFEYLNGFPNYWGWGLEDNLIQNRALTSKIAIDRSQFNTVNSDKYNQTMHGYTRVLDTKVQLKYTEDDGSNGITDIKDISHVSLISVKYVEVQFKSWTITENPENIVFETRTNPTKITQPKYNIKDFL